jgi:phosphate transport system protein
MTEHQPGRQERQGLDRELGAIEAKVIELFAMVAEDLPRATDALLNGNSEAVRALAERDRVIDGLYPEIEELADHELLLQQPAASDFRLLISVLRVVPELERSHDLIVDIARRGNLILSQDLSARSRGLIEHMGNLASEMWREAVDCWCERDRSAAVGEIVKSCGRRVLIDHAATLFSASSGRSMSTPFSNMAPARTRATRCGPLT